MITVAVSELLLAVNRDTLRHFRVDSPLTEEAREVIHKLPNLCGLTVITKTVFVQSDEVRESVKS